MNALAAGSGISVTSKNGRKQTIMAHEDKLKKLKENDDNTPKDSKNDLEKLRDSAVADIADGFDPAQVISSVIISAQLEAFIRIQSTPVHERLAEVDIATEEAIAAGLLHSQPRPVAGEDTDIPEVDE